jgi:hypothetical protein
MPFPLNASGQENQQLASSIARMFQYINFTTFQPVRCEIPY